jgi:branched-chain amino acid transport system permease protein
VDAGVLLQAVLTGLASGAVVGLVALGFTLVAGTVRVLHLAHGDVAVAAVLTAVLVVVGRTPVAVDLGPGGGAALVAVCLAAGALLAAAVAVAVVRPALPDAARGRTGDPLGWVAGGVAAGLALREVLGLLLPQEAYAVPDPLGLGSLPALDLPGGAVLAGRVPAVLLLALVLGVVAERVLVLSRFGRSLRAVADEPDAAALCGVPAGRVVLLALAAAGLLAGAAGLLDATSTARAVAVDDGVLLGLAGTAAALLGGLGSLRGALVGGLAVGLLQSLVVTYHGGEWSAVVPLALLVVVVAVRPEGARRRRPVGAVA